MKASKLEKSLEMILTKQHLRLSLHLTEMALKDCMSPTASFR